MRKNNHLFLLVILIFVVIVLSYIYKPNNTVDVTKQTFVNQNLNQLPDQEKAHLKQINVESRKFFDDRLRLAGIIESDTNNLALISVNNAEADIYSINSRIIDEIMLIEIKKNYVTLQTDENEWKLYIRNAENNTISSSDSDTNETGMRKNTVNESAHSDIRGSGKSWINRDINGQYVVDNNSNLDEFGFLSNDIILKINGKSANHKMVTKLNRFLTKPPTNRSLDITINRNGSLLELSITGRDKTAK